MSRDRSKFIELLRHRIESDEGLNVSSLATKAGLDNSTIRTMLRDGRNPRLDTMEKICAALGTTVEDFISEANDPVRSEILYLLDHLAEDELKILLAAIKGIHVADLDRLLQYPLGMN